MLSPLNASKSNNRNSWKSDNFRESDQTRADMKNEAKKIKSDTFTRSHREKSNIATLILERLIIREKYDYFGFFGHQ